MNITLKTIDNFALDVIFNQPPHSTRVVIFTHGMTVNKDDEGIFVRAEQLLNDAGFSTIRFDFRAHGASSGASEHDFTISGELVDLATIMTFAQEKEFEWIGLAGASFGGGIAALYSGSHPNDINALLLANPVLDYQKCFLQPSTPWAKKHFERVFDRLEHEKFIKIGSRQFKAGKKLFEEMSSYFPFQELEKYQGPLLVMHGTKDSKVSYQDTLEICEKLSNSQKNFVTIEGSEHGFHEEPYQTKVVELIVNFFAVKTS